MSPCCRVASWERMVCYTQDVLVYSNQDIRAHKRASAVQNHVVADVCVHVHVRVCEVAATLCWSLPTATYELLLMFSLSGIPVGKETQGSFMMCGKEKVIQESVLDLKVTGKDMQQWTGRPRVIVCWRRDAYIHEEFVSPQSWNDKLHRFQALWFETTLHSIVSCSQYSNRNGINSVSEQSRGWQNLLHFHSIFTFR